MLQLMVFSHECGLLDRTYNYSVVLCPTTFSPEKTNWITIIVEQKKERVKVTEQCVTEYYSGIQKVREKTEGSICNQRLDQAGTI